MAPKIVDRNAKKDEIIQAALQVFARRGFANTKISDIASLAGIGKGTIYEYFRSKEEIFAAAYQSISGTFDSYLLNALATVKKPVLKLKLLFELNLDFFGKDALDFSAVMLQFWAEGIRTMDKETQGVINLKQLYRDYRIMIMEIVKEGQQAGVFRDIDSMAFASLAIASLDGLLLQLVTDPDVFDLQKIKNVFVETLLKTIVIDEKNKF